MFLDLHASSKNKGHMLTTKTVDLLPKPAKPNYQTTQATFA
jgi:hypothetical protein